MSSPMYPPPPPMVPPPPMPTGPVTKAPAVGWVAAVAGLFGLLGLLLPWFTPTVSSPEGSQASDTSFHAWNGYLFLIIAPVLLILFGVLWVQALRGRTNSRFAASADPVKSLSLQSIIAGAASTFIALLSFLIITATFRFKTDSSSISWSSAEKLIKANGGALSRGPQAGLWLVIAGGLILLVVGMVGFLRANGAGTPAAVAFPPAGPPQNGFGPSQGGFGPPASPPQGGFGPPQGGFGPSPASPSQGGFGPPQVPPPGAMPPPASW